MIATALTLVLIGIVIAALAHTLGDNGGKIIAALHGQSCLTEPPMSVRPVTVRFSQRYPAVRPIRARPELRAAA